MSKVTKKTCNLSCKTKKKKPADLETPEEEPVYLETSNVLTTSTEPPIILLTSEKAPVIFSKEPLVSEISNGQLVSETSKIKLDCSCKCAASTAKSSTKLKKTLTSSNYEPYMADCIFKKLEEKKTCLGCCAAFHDDDILVRKKSVSIGKIETINASDYEFDVKTIKPAKKPSSRTLLKNIKDKKKEDEPYMADCIFKKLEEKKTCGGCCASFHDDDIPVRKKSASMGKTETINASDYQFDNITIIPTKKPASKTLSKDIINKIKEDEPYIADCLLKKQEEKETCVGCCAAFDDDDIPVPKKSVTIGKTETINTCDYESDVRTIIPAEKPSFKVVLKDIVDKIKEEFASDPDFDIITVMQVKKPPSEICSPLLGCGVSNDADETTPEDIETEEKGTQTGGEKKSIAEIATLSNKAKSIVESSEVEITSEDTIPEERMFIPKMDDTITLEHTVYLGRQLYDTTIYSD